jgi:high-affinity iron transporter
VQDELTGEALEIFQTATLFVAAGLITQMVLWMRKHGRQMKARLHADLAAARERSGYLGVAVVAALAVAREGAETVIFLYGLAQEGDLTPLWVGSLAGFGAAGATAWLAARSLARLNIALLLRLSSILLLILASALLLTAIDRLIGAGWLPPLLDPVWDSSRLLDDTTTGGKLIADFSGYRARPTLSGLLAWLSYWGVVLIAWRRTAMAEQVIQFHPSRPRNRLEKIGLFLRRNRRLIIGIQWLIVILYAAMVIIPAFLPLPPEDAHIWDNLRCSRNSASGACGGRA